MRIYNFKQSKLNDPKQIIIVCLLTILLFGSKCLMAQDNLEKNKITIKYDQVAIDSILKDLQTKIPYRFFYDIQQLDTNRLYFNFLANNIDDALERILHESNLHFSIFNKNIFITKGSTVSTQLPQYNIQEDSDSILVNKKEESRFMGKEIQVAARDNKTVVIGNNQSDKNINNFAISGFVRDAKTGEPVGAASLFISNSPIGSVADQYGFFKLMLSRGVHTLNIQSIGMEDRQIPIKVIGEGRINISMDTRIIALKGVVVTAEKMNTIRNTQLGVQKLNIKTIKQVPVVFGEADVLRVLLTTPGVKSVGEASTGLNVRGGSADQNLILFNETHVFNPAHFFGMFSAFNPEIVKEVEIFKASIPAKYGGRLSSVININTKEGNKKKYEGSAGVGLLTTRFNLEGPIVKDKSSFIIGGRTTYANWLLKKLPSEYKNSKAGFYDANIVLTHELNKKNTLYITGYMSKDQFNLNSDTVYAYNNYNASLKWRHSFHNKLYSLTSVGFDKYQYQIHSKRIPVNAYKMSFDISQLHFKSNFNYLVNNKHSIDYGFNGNLYFINPGSYVPYNNESQIIPKVMQREQALEMALYFSDTYKISRKLSADLGLRYSMYSFLGPNTVNNYRDGALIIEDNLISTTQYSKGKNIKTYQGPEFRIGIRQLINATLSVKAGYNSLRQNIHMLTNTTAMAPTDIWKLSDAHIKPQSGDQLSLGLFKSLKSNTVEISLEGYYKRIKNYLDFRSGAKLVLNKHIETDILPTNGKAYGVEFQLKKLTGKLNGWISYTYSRILLKADNFDNGEIINNGAYYPANYDKPHDATIVGNYKVSHRFSLSLNATYSTGRPITLPIGKYYYNNSFRTLYGNRNEHRIPDYFRMDFSMNIDGNHKLNQKTHNSWTIGIYNLTGRKNPFSVYYVSENGVINGYKLSIFGTAIPYINFNIRF